MNAIILIAHLGLTAAPALQVVVPERDEPEACFANETIASALRLGPGIRVLRTRLRPEESLAHLQRRADAEVVIDGRFVSGSERPHVMLEIHVRGRPAERRTMYGSVLATFEAMWPKDLPRPPRAPAFTAANDEALFAACKDQVELALAASGGAVGDAVRRRLALRPSPATRNGKGRAPLLERWLDASRFAARGEYARAFPLLLGLKNEFEAGVSAPAWRWPGSPELEAHSVQVEAGLAFVFGRDRLVVLELDSGRVRLSMPIDKLEPQVVMLGPTRALAFGANRAFELELEAPARSRREIPLEGVAPEVVLGANEIVLAGNAEVVALAKESSQELWRQELTDNLVAGPVMLGERLIVPGDARLFVLAKDSGKIVETLDLPDELAGPLYAADTGLYMLLGGDQVARLTWNGGPNLLVWTKDLFGASWPPVPFEDSVALATRAPRRPPVVSQLTGGERPFLRVIERGADAPLAPLPGGGLVFVDARRTLLTGKDAKGRVTLRARSTQRFELVTSGQSHVLAQAGPLVLALAAPGGETKQRIELPVTPKSTALSERGGIVLLPDGVVYGLPPVDDLRMAAFGRMLRLELAEAAVRTGRTSVGKKLADELLERDPEDLDALALVARSSPRNTAASAWYRVLELAAPVDPLRAMAEAELQKLSGLERRVAVSSPIRTVWPAGAESLLIEDERRLTAFPITEPAQPAWSLAKKEAAAVGAFIRVDDNLVDPKSGRVLRSLGGKRPIDPRGLYFTSAEAEPRLSLESPTGQVLFTQRFEDRSIRLLEASSDTLILADDTELGTVHALSAVDGARRWMRPFEEHIEAAHQFEATSILRTPTRLVAVETDTGKLLFETSLPKNEVVSLSLQTSVGLLVISEKRLTLYEIKRGRPIRVLPLEQPVVMSTLADPYLLVANENGRVVAFDLSRGRKGGSLDIDKPQQLFTVGDRFGLVEAQGRAFSLFEAKRILAP